MLVPHSSSLLTQRPPECRRRQPCLVFFSPRLAVLGRAGPAGPAWPAWPCWAMVACLADPPVQDCVYPCRVRCGTRNKHVCIELTWYMKCAPINNGLPYEHSMSDERVMEWAQRAQRREWAQWKECLSDHVHQRATHHQCTCIHQPVQYSAPSPRPRRPSAHTRLHECATVRLRDSGHAKVGSWRQTSP